MRPTTHFEEQWEKRVGERAPTRRELDCLIRESVQLQQFRIYFTPRGFRQKVLAMYWHPEQKMVFKVDEPAGRVVTVLSPRVLEERREKQQGRGFG